jgi:branched-subunit amino acid aminotransferase/4-amino-4-deoxychorismate lyase/sugar phosphate isomerase/epimerase
VIVSAFADEIASDVAVQLAVLERHAVSHVDLRAVNARNVIELDDAEVVALRDRLREHGIAVAAIASPIGKEPADGDPAALRGRLGRAAAVARLFGTDLIRVFAFHRPENGGDWKEASLRSLRTLASCARREGVRLLLENEVRTRADTAEHAAELLEALGDAPVCAAYDPANALRCGDTPYPDGYAHVKPWLWQVHVKDLDEDGRVVPAGCGRANWPGLLQALTSSGYQGFVSLEPHLLRAGRAGGFTGPTLFAEAHHALHALITSSSVRSVGATMEGDGGHRSLSPTKYPQPTETASATRGWRSTPSVFLACVDGQISPPDEVLLSATDQGFLRGHGASEVVEVYRGRPIELDRHMDRLARACESILLDFPRDEILGDLATLLEESGPVDCLWRIRMARDATRLHLLEWLPPDNRRGTPLTLKTVRYQPTVPTDFSAMSNGPTMTASRRGSNDGDDERLVIHADGTVLEPATASVLWAKDGVLMTSTVESGIQPSITRMVLMEALETQEVSATLDELFAADEVFLASTPGQVRPVRRIDDVKYEEAPGPLCRAAQRALDRAIAREVTFAENER